MRGIVPKTFITVEGGGYTYNMYFLFKPIEMTVGLVLIFFNSDFKEKYNFLTHIIYTG